MDIFLVKKLSGFQCYIQMYIIYISSAKNWLSTTTMPKHRQDNVQLQQPVGFSFVEGPEMKWANDEALYQHFKNGNKDMNSH